ncbi:MAG: hypothetical protein ACW99A_24025, partial [Candidatus Kariarchaeaceae archaeon]|jgi:hypothetical protein
VNSVDKKFDKAERIWDRFQKLLLKIVGGVVGISLACYIAYGQLRDKHEETVNAHNVEEKSTDIKESAPEHKETYKIIKQTYLVDDYGHRKGDTVYIDYYDDGFIDKYYKSDGKIYYEED